ncbi:sulfate transporter-like [Sphaerodactylus townsendi]|uniref:sulfate transporter-like n=1 Tax=Sphaerodactylus townsendi TaxID=933632 RepID=UPI0020274A8C|nr:sulfate transporter-like [Sphaerodactylus townsendi]
MESDPAKCSNDLQSSHLPKSSSHYTPIKLEEYEPPVFSAKKLLKKAKESCRCGRQSIITFFFNLFPVLEWLPRYNVKEQLLGDIISGLLVGIVAIPQSISYSILASQDPIYGLYTNFFCAIVYFFMATSHHNCVGSFGVLCLMIGESVNRQLKLAGFEADVGASSVANATLNGTVACDKSCYAITVATTLTFLVGIYQIVLGVFQMGFISVYLSEPLLSGFVTGSSLTILTSQMNLLLGLKIPRHDGVGSLVLTWFELFRYIWQTNICDLVTSLIALILIVPIKEINNFYRDKMKAPFPMELLVVIAGTLLSHFFNFKERYKSKICGNIPTGFKQPVVPDLSLLSNVALDAVPIAIIGFAMTVSLSDIFGKKHGYPVRANQEMIAIGMGNLIPSFFYCFASCAALSKTLLKESTGCHTQISSLISSFVLLLVLLWIAPLFYSLQTCILGVVTIVNLRGGLRRFSDTPKMWRISKTDTVIWWVTMLSSSLISTELGLLIGVCFSLLCIIFRTQRPRATLLGKVSNSEIYEDQFNYKRINSVANIKIFRFDTSLYYANKDYFKRSLFQKTGVNPSLVAAIQQKAEAGGKSENCFSSKFSCLKATKKEAKKASINIPVLSFDMHTLIIDCGAMQFLDSTGLNVLKETRQDYKKIGIQVLLANCNPSLRHLLQVGGWLTGMEDMELLSFHSIHAAVQFAEKQSKAQRESKVVEGSFLSPEAQDLSKGSSLNESL